MTEETPKSKRKRRRWSIAGVVLLVLIVSGWWHWPRGDARFVGRWKVDVTATGEAEPRARTATILSLKGNGTGEVYDLHGTHLRSFAWTLLKNDLNQGWPTSERSTNLMLWTFQNHLPDALAKLPIDFRSRRVMTVSRDLIELTGAPGEAITMRRLPE